MLVKYLKITIYTSFCIILASYIFVQALIYKGNQELQNTRTIVFSIHQLKDLHTICILDYQYNVGNNEMLQECKKVENKIATTLENYYDKTPYLNFYKEYLE